MASSGSSTTESASDVSLSHLFHLSPSTCRVTRRSGTSRGVSHLDVSVSDIWKKFLFEAISAFFGLSMAGVFILGLKLASP